jgi:hypothetical protein
MGFKDVDEVDMLDFQDILVDLLNSLSVVRSLSEIENHQYNTNEKELVLNALNILMSEPLAKPIKPKNILSKMS